MIAQSGLPRVLIRRWRATAGGLVLTLLLCLLAAFVVSAKYTAKESVLLVPPRDSVTGANPYLNLDTLDGLNSVLVQGLSSASTEDGLRAQGVTGSYTVADDPNSSGPVLIITGTAATPAAAISMARHVGALVPRTLQRLQAQLAVPVKSIVTTTVLSPANNATKVRKSQIRAVILAAAVGIFGTLVGVGALDRLLSRHSVRIPRLPGLPKIQRGPRRRPEAAGELPLYEDDDTMTVLVPTRGSER